MMAVRIANELARSHIESHIVATRSIGELESQVLQNVPVFCINKRNAFDIIAFARLLFYVKRFKITHIHAHSNSIYFAILLKLFCVKLRVIWHDHYGNSEYVHKRRVYLLKRLARYIDAEIAVNDLLKDWAQSYLKVDNVVVINNIVDTRRFCKSPLPSYEGEINILLLANFREQKNHFLALDILRRLENLHPGIFSLHLVGQVIESDYFLEVEKRISECSLNIHVHTGESDSRAMIEKSHICLITSRSEGLPLAVLEYAAIGRPIVASAVGQIPHVIENEVSGIVCNPLQDSDFAAAIMKFVQNQNLRISCVEYARKMIETDFSGEAFILRYIMLLNTAGCVMK